MNKKTCIKCGLIKNLDNFYNDTRLKSGKGSSCKTCRNLVIKKSKFKNSNNINKTRKIYYKNNKQKELENNKKYTIENKEKVHDMRLKYNMENREKINVNANERRRRDLRVRFAMWKHNAKRRNIDFNITYYDVECLERKCFYTGVELTLEPNEFNTISLDRLDNNECYTKNNVVLCCWAINEIKKTKSVVELLDWCERIYLNKNNILAKIGTLPPGRV
jgi:hypothetical protein